MLLKRSLTCQTVTLSCAFVLTIRSIFLTGSLHSGAGRQSFADQLLGCSRWRWQAKRPPNCGCQHLSTRREKGSLTRGIGHDATISRSKSYLAFAPFDVV